MMRVNLCLGFDRARESWLQARVMRFRNICDLLKWNEGATRGRVLVAKSLH